MPKPYATITVKCCRCIKFQYYLAMQHQQAKRGQEYQITCYSFKEVAYYQEMFKTLKKWLAIKEIQYA